MSSSQRPRRWSASKAGQSGRCVCLTFCSPRGYRLAEEKRLVVVNTMIRLPNVIFSGGAVGKAPRESRSGLHILEEDMYNLLSESV